MPGALVIARTKIAANRLNIRCQLTMGLGAKLRFCVPDQTEMGGIKVLREYTTAFNRVGSAERESGDGAEIVVEIADVFPSGQLRGDIEAAKLIQLVQDGVPSPFYGDLDVPTVNPERTQLFRISARTEAFKQTYYKVGHGGARR